MATIHRHTASNHEVVVSARELMDSTVYDREHKKLGIVSDVVFEAENGLLAFVRITLDDQHTVVVPYDAIEIDLDTHCLCVKMYRQTVGKFTDRDAP